LIIAWDEHGGFYDHVIPPAGVPPNDRKLAGDDRSKNGFLFDLLGPRVPALIISPRIPKNLIDHRLYDHSTIPATIERLFGLKALTDRDASANAPINLLTLTTPRTDTPATIGISVAAAMTTLSKPALVPAHPEADVTKNKVTAFLSSAIAVDLKISPPAQRQAIIERAKTIHTHAQAAKYMSDVQQRLKAYRAGRPTAAGAGTPTA
jgi:phospholipase C